MEKLAYSLILAARKLRPYFQSHKILVKMTFPLRQVLHRPEMSGRMLKWAVELGQFDIDYKPRTAIKGQTLVDFILEFTNQDMENPLAIVELQSTQMKGDRKSVV